MPSPSRIVAFTEEAEEGGVVVEVVEVGVVVVVVVVGAAEVAGRTAILAQPEPVKIRQGKRGKGR
jgi:hypothetical protein